jgi:tetratricopeptide (TPR) repeat protein
MKKIPLLSILTVLTAGMAIAGKDDRPLVPLFKGLGRHHHEVTTRYELAQRYFDQGLTLCFNFNHAEAVRSFEAAAAIDPDCAMAYWGAAYALGPNINAPMFDDAVPKAWDALQKALAAKTRASQREQDYIDALARRYEKDPPKDRSALNQAYADAMRDLAGKYAEDWDAQTLFAEALMDTAPWNYWQADRTPKPAAREAIAAIERVLARVNAHSGADHLYIHLVEAGPHPDRGVPSADRIGRLTPRAGHLVHMASHIYVRVGRFHDAVAVNERASGVDENYLSAEKPTGVYPGGYYPHNLHFLWYANDILGRSRQSLDAAKKLSRYTLDLRCGAIEGPRQRYVPLLSNARFGRWDSILNEPEPSKEYPFDRTVWRYARALAFAAKGQADDADREYSRFQELKASEAVKALDNPYFPGTKILAVADPVVAGKIAAARGAKEASVEHLRKAVAAEDDIPYMEPPYWYYSVRESLGAALLKAGQSAEAEKIFREDLEKLPENGWGLFGLAESLRSQGKTAEARQIEKRFRQAWKRADVEPDLAWF